MVANVRLPVRNSAARHVSIVSAAFARLGHKVTLFLPFPNSPFRPDDCPPGVEIRWGADPGAKLPSPARTGRVSAAHQILPRISWLCRVVLATLRREYDWLYLYHPSPECFLIACLARLSGRRICVEQVDGFDYPHAKFSWKDYSYLQLEKASMRICKSLSSLVVVISSRLEKGSRGRVLRIPSLVDCARFESGNAAWLSERLGHKKGPWIVYSGTLSAHAGFQFLIEGMPFVLQRVPDAHLVLAGYAGELSESPEAIIQKQGLQHAAHYLGMLDSGEVVNLLAAADVLVMPKDSTSMNEFGFPSKLAEYLASGRPVVSTRISDIPEYVSHGENAYLCPPGNAQALAEAIVDLLTASPEVRAAIGQAGRRLARTCFDVNVNCSRILAAMAELR
jgi:glycosyltransferase involved in cell wall biosynthesis